MADINAFSTNLQQVERNREISETIDKYQARLLGFVRKRVKNQDDAEDLVQDVFVQFINSYDLVDPIRNVTSWLFTVARNKVTDFYRKKRPVNFSDMALTAGIGDEDDDASLYLEEIYFDDVNDPQQNLLRTAVWEELDVALSDLPEEQRNVFIAHELDGKSFRELAEETGLPVNTLISRKRYAVLHLRSRLSLVYDELLNDL